MNTAQNLCLSVFPAIAWRPWWVQGAKNTTDRQGAIFAIPGTTGAVSIPAAFRQDSALCLSCAFFKNQKSKLRPLQHIKGDYANPGRYISPYVPKNQRKIKEEALRNVMGMENLCGNETANPKSA